MRRARSEKMKHRSVVAGAAPLRHLCPDVKGRASPLRHPQSTSGRDEPARRRRSPYPLQRTLMRNLAVPAQQAGWSEFLALWAGQSAGIAQYPDVATLLQSLVNGVSEKLA